MALNIKDVETDRVARELAAATGETITVATRRALEERLARVRVRAGRRAAEERIGAIIRRGRTRAIDDRRPVNDILGYDEHGLPA